MSHREMDVVADRLLDHLADNDPVVSLEDKTLVITIRVNATAQMAVAIAVSIAWDAFDLAGASLRIVSASQVSSVAIERHAPLNEPLKLLNASECARELELSRQRVAQLIDARDFPAPTGYVAGRPVWRLNVIRAYKSARQGRTSRAR